ncbi:MAG TPA: response regulator transcription factor [Bacteroidales bacterium]|nr:response regulator transcription factor [Bacteroidales bacterium]
MENNDVIKILIVDDHPVVRKGLREILGEVGGTQIVAEADGGEEALQILLKTQVDVVITDLIMPKKMNGLDLTEKIKEKYKDKIKIIVFTVSEEGPILDKIFNAGAEGFLLKEADSNDFSFALQKITNGTHYYCERFHEIRARYKSKREEEEKEKKILTKREWEVLDLILDGKTYAEIANKLNIKEVTVRVYKDKMMSAINAKTTIDLIKYGIRCDEFSASE